MGTPSFISRSQSLMEATPSLLAMRFTPFEEFPSSVAVPRHRSRYSLAVRLTPPTGEYRSTPSTADLRRQTIRALASPTTTVPLCRSTPSSQVCESRVPTGKPASCAIPFPTRPKLHCSSNFTTRTRYSRVVCRPSRADPLIALGRTSGFRLLPIDHLASFTSVSSTCTRNRSCENLPLTLSCPRLPRC